MDRVCNIRCEMIEVAPSQVKPRKYGLKYKLLKKNKPVSLLSLPVSIISQRQLSTLISLIFMEFPTYFCFVIRTKFEYVTNTLIKAYSNMHQNDSLPFQDGDILSA